MRICDFSDCGRRHNARGLCTGHGAQRAAGTPLRPLRSKAYRQQPICLFEDCGRPTRARNLCERHWAQDHAGLSLKAIPPHAEIGDTKLWDTGYVCMKTAKGWELQHRFVMSQTLGRALLPGENVHHKNGVRHDNRPTNLELWVSHQPAGQRPVDLLEWADEIIRRYDNIRVLPVG